MAYFIIFLCLGTGFFMLISYKLRLPPISTARGVRKAVMVKTDALTVLQEKLVLPLARLISPLIRIEAFKERRMLTQLERAEIALSPCEYYARAIVMSVLVFLSGSAAALLMMPQMIVVIAVLSVIIYFHFFGEVRDKLKAKDKLIESELPKFIRAVVQGMKTEKDVIKLLETYETVAKQGLKYDIEILIMDLKSGNFEDGMLRFDRRIGNAYVSRLTKALISANRGDNQDAALHHLLSDMTLLAHETIKRELDKRPGKVKILVIPIVVIGIFTLFYVIGVHLFNSLGGIM